MSYTCRQDTFTLDSPTLNCILPAIYVVFTCRRDIFILDQPTLNCSLPASYVVFTCRRDFFFSESPTLNCMLHYVCILPHAFCMTFSDVRFSSFCCKKRPPSGLTSHKCVKPTLAARSVVYAATMSSCRNRRV